KDKLEAIKPRCKAVLRGFAHLRKGEDIEGYRTATEWCKNTFGVTYEWMRRCLNPSKDSTPTFEDLRIAKFLPSPDSTETKIQAVAVVAPLPKMPEANEGGERQPSVIESLANTKPPY